MGIRLYGFLANLAGSGRLVQRGRSAGSPTRATMIGSVLVGVPLIGEGAADGVSGALAGAGEPLITFGTDLERLLLIISALLGLLLVAVALIPWLNRYLPWRIAKWRRLNAASRGIRGAVDARRRSEPIRRGG